MAQYQCKSCLAIANLPDDADQHDPANNWCNCCTEDHHHGTTTLDAPVCEAQNHPGQPCWHPPTQPVKPEGCTVCRPIVHIAELVIDMNGGL